MSAIAQMKPQVTPQRLMQMAWSFALPVAIESAVQNRIFDVLDSGPKNLTDICRETNCSERGAEAVMNLLVSVELLSKDRHGLYALTPESEAFLVSTSPSFQGSMLGHITKHLMPQFLHLDEAVKTGEPARKSDEPNSMALFFKSFVSGLFPVNLPAAQATARHLASLRKNETRKILDLAAGSGVWGITFAQAFPDAQLTAVDYPEVLEVTRNMVKKFDLDGRYHEIGGALAQVKFGSGYSVATLGHILHSAGEEESRELLHKTYQALDPGGSIVIGEFLLNEDRTSPTFATIFNVNMLVNTEKGKAFSFWEIESWLTECGFHDIRTLDVPAPSPVILAEK